MRRIYAIGIGGSGAKCLEAVTFLHAIGIFGDSCLNILLVDADHKNGNGNRTRINIDNALKCREAFDNYSGEKSQFMAGKFKHFSPPWNPLRDETSSSDLSKIFQKQALTSSEPPLAKLFNALYSPAEQVADLKVGFRGRPPIGSAIMGRLELQTLESESGQKQWTDLFKDVQDARGNGEEVSIHLFGSIFGGTGASGVPTLATLIAEQLTKNSLRDNVHLNASVLLPYFGFEKPNDGDIFAETHLFALNTKAALQHLKEHSDKNFNTVYVIGHESRKNYKSHTGGTQQQNEAHFVELYAALAINHGFKQPINKETQAAYISVTSPDRLGWQDLPDSDKVKKLLSTGVRFAYSWYYNFSLELVAAQTLGAKKFAIGAPWFRFFFSLKKEDDSGWPPVGDEEQKKQAETLTKWTKGFLLWAQQIAQSHPKGEQLFRLKEFNLESEDRNYGEDLSKLIIDFPEKSAKEKARDRLDTFKNKLADQGKKSKGVIGLAHELFSLL
ncbi:MAG: hypothetical protein KA717_17660 [Woronichinia naegeliana WA131]|jgi:hypothetical protein|uniref:Uncharacterized protein n=1 Tax=Woronichinia naegeliana WA131 TaxID=2824559 RepID=A0A977L243_9CYAN|nr:MAG: hypothetical protein KA717_17660 [Woronichinia naegeliana WA131]